MLQICCEREVFIRKKITNVGSQTDIPAEFPVRHFHVISSRNLGICAETAQSVKNCKIKVFSSCFSRLFGAECVYTSNPNQVGAATPTATPIGAHRPLPDGSFLHSFNFSSFVVG